MAQVLRGTRRRPLSRRVFNLKAQLPNLMWAVIWGFVALAFILPWMVPGYGG
jgi:hypothetical protein